jgi:radical SAM protein with 4Fe4S-binding SPASM domain
MTGPQNEIWPKLRLCVWEITGACNLKCIHCIVNAGKKSSDELTTDEAFDFIGELAECGCDMVALSGGEPLVRKDWPELAARVTASGMTPVMASNGWLVNERIIDKMIETGVRGVAVSIDGDEATHTAVRGPKVYQRAIEAIRLLVESPIETGVMTQIHKSNLDELDRLYETVVSLGVDRWQLQIAVPAGRMLSLDREYLISVSDIPRIEEKIAAFSARGEVRVMASDNIGYYGPHEPSLRKNRKGEPLFWTGCQAGQSVVGVCPNGDVKGCPSLPKEFVVGNVRRKRFRDIWRDDDGFAYTRKWDGSLLEGKCAECPFARICKAGCTCMAYAVTGTVYDNPFCSQRAQ